MAHSKIGASSMYRWSKCPGSVKLSEGIESKSSSYADEGTKAHELAAQWLSTDVQPICDEETLEALTLYINTVVKDASYNEILIEQKFDLSGLYPGLYGTADAVVYDPTSRILRVYDYKHGKGLLVEVEGNSQLMYYGLGALLHTRYPASEVELVIVQPRAEHVDGPVRRWRFKSFDLVEFAADLVDFAEKTALPNAELVPGDHCRFCPAAGICPSLSQKALAVAQTEFSPTLSYDPLKLSETLTKLDMLEGYAKSVREFAYGEAEHGRCPPGWKLVEKRATRKWKPNIDAGALLSIFNNEDHLYEKKLKSPAQLEKLVGPHDKKLIANLVIAISSGLTLVQESDSRQPALLDAASEFNVITGENV